MSISKKPWWEPALEIFSEVTSWIVGPIIFSLIVGKYLDGKFDTKPWIFLGLTAVAFVVSTYGIIKTGSRYMKQIIKETERNKEKKDGNETRN